MVQHVKQVTIKKSEFVRQDQAKYQVEIIKNKKGKIKQLRVTYTIYPLLSQGYDNYQELNVHIKRLIKYTSIEAYFIRESWNGDGYDPICYQRLRVGDEFFNFVIGDSDVRDVVIQLFKRLKDVLENNGKGGDCYYATYYFHL